VRKKDSAALGWLIVVGVILGLIGQVLSFIGQILEKYGVVISWVLVAVGGFFLVKYLVEWSLETAEEERKLKEKRIKKEQEVKKKRMAERGKIFASLVIERSHDLIAAEDKLFIDEYLEKTQNKSNRNRIDFINSINKVKHEIKALVKKNNLPKLASIVGKTDRFILSSKQNYDKEIDKLNKSMAHSKVSYLMVSEYGIRVEKVTVAHRGVLVAALNKLLDLKSKINAYLVHREKMRVDMLFEKETMNDDSMGKQIIEEINLTGDYVDDLLKTSKVVFDHDEGITPEDTVQPVETVSVKEMNRPQFVQQVGVVSVKETNRKQFVQSVGATCNNWTWSWSFINEEKKFVLFGYWENLEDEVGSLILKKEWEVGVSGRKAPGYRQALEHLELVENKGYQLKVFKMIGTNGGSDNAKITAIDHHVAERDLKRVGNYWYATVNR